MKQQRAFVSSIWSVTLAIVGVHACSKNTADFAEIKVSEEAQAEYVEYEKIRENSEFKEILAKSLDLIADGVDEALVYPKELKVKGKLFTNAQDTMKRNLKLRNVKFKKKYGQQLEPIKSLPIKAADFQLAQDILHDYLSISGNVKALNDAMKKYSAEEHLRAARADLILSAVYSSQSEQNSKKVRLALIDSTGTSAAFEGAADLGKTLANNYSPESKSKAKLNDAKAKLTEAEADKIETCVKEWLKNVENKWDLCANSNKASVQCNAGWSRNDPDESVKGASLKEGWSKPTFSGVNESNSPDKANCNLHRYRCHCAQSRMWVLRGKWQDPPTAGPFNPEDRGGYWYSADHDTTGCNMVHAPEVSPPKPRNDERILEQGRRACEIMNGVKSGSKSSDDSDT